MVTILSRGLAISRPPMADSVRCGPRKRSSFASPRKTKTRKAEHKKEENRNNNNNNNSDKRNKPKAGLTWQCANGCGACCKLAKGPDFPSPEETFYDDPANLQLYKSLIGTDGWCIHYEQETRRCSIYNERPLFCRAEPEEFEKLFGIQKWRFNKEVCRACVDTIKSVYGSTSEEFNNFNRLIRGR